jgi:glucose/arabinose dehydrogenase
MRRGRVYASEHGPRGGDEINRIEGGKNYGWPIQTFGLDYNTREPVGKPSVPGMVDPLVAWVPSPAPSGLALYTGKAFPQWRGSLFSGSLAGMDVRRVELDSREGRAPGKAGYRQARARRAPGAGRPPVCADRRGRTRASCASCRTNEQQ